ncbi:MAG TPA: ATP-binding protein [Cryptosporangiaceae bacterium]|nr:ATP-binding protein [Cryptosporangiaceae bacterium]
MTRAGAQSMFRYPDSSGDEPIRARIRLEPAPTSARTARRFISDTLGTCTDPDLVDAATLLVSELVTNAFVHAASPTMVVVDSPADHAAVRVEVHDDGLAPPRLGGFEPYASGGRGLALVAAMSERWGVDQGTDGKRVWFELRTDRALQLEAS